MSKNEISNSLNNSIRFTFYFCKLVDEKIWKYKKKQLPIAIFIFVPKIGFVFVRSNCYIFELDWFIEIGSSLRRNLRLRRKVRTIFNTLKYKFPLSLYSNDDHFPYLCFRCKLKPIHHHLYRQSDQIYLHIFKFIIISLSFSISDCSEYSRYSLTYLPDIECLFMLMLVNDELFIQCLNVYTDVINSASVYLQ